jgi:2-oxoglutarate dehydrogenase E1 component
MTTTPRFDDFGPNSGLVEEMYREYLTNPSSVAESWRDFFADYSPPGAPPSPPAEAPVPAPTAPAAPTATAATPAATKPAAAPAAAPVDNGATATPLRGAAARIVENMEASLAVPTATSVRVVPAKLLEVNRLIVNNHLARARGGKVSFTHLIGFAVLKALAEVPAMNASYRESDGQRTVTRHPHVNLGLAIDIQKSDGSRTLLVPNIKQADTLDFATYFTAYEDLIRRSRNNKLSPDDFAGTTVSITNPGTIGTVHSVPRLMPGQGVIVGVGAIEFPAEYQGADPRTLARLGVGKVITLTSTYDHRIIQGAESGEFLRRMHELLIGGDGFYDNIFASLGVPYEPARWRVDDNPDDEPFGQVEKQTRVNQLINMYRVRGHLIADLDPLDRKEPHTHPELDPVFWGLSIWDLDREFITEGLAGKQTMRLREILSVLRDAYARTVGLEFMHIQEPEQKSWIQERVEGVPTGLPLPDKRRILERLGAAEAFERFLHTKYLGHKRFSLEGAETLIPMLDALLNEAADAQMSEAVLGMAHRGRLNVLANTLDKSYSQIFREFEGDLDPTSAQGSGDVKYHLGASGKHAAPSGNTITVTLASNPSHLEAVDPVVEGMARAKQDRAGDHEGDVVLPVLVHGDAAFAGQGVVAETLNLSQLPGYETGGTIHIVVNNQVGFTTAPESGRSSVYATDVAKMVQAPIFHANGDDPEACVRVIRLAFAFRQAFRKDVVVDMVCYRRYGHNEADEPAYTQPRMYAVIEARRSVRKLFTEALINRGDITLDEAEAALNDFQARLESAFAETHQSERPKPEAPPRMAPERATPVSTAVPREELERVVTAVSTVPDGFTVHPKLAKQIDARRKAFDTDTIDWALAEHLAIGTLLLEGTSVRLAGQDTRRGTFSQRHSTLVDFHSEAEYVPLEGLATDGARYMIYDSLLSEYAALGFEYGYSVADPDAFVAWEAQFGDFANGGQIILDQFITAAEDKWGQQSGLVLLLPHGFEGQGPEHSSARLERYLQLCAEDNLRVVYPTTAAQYFHALRRQCHAPVRKPLIVITPKKYLRMPSTRSAVADFTSAEFAEVLDDPSPPETVERVLACTGKIGHELIERRDKESAAAVVLRIEQLYPFPHTALHATLAKYPGASLHWVQEEPENMGGWRFVEPRLRLQLDGRGELGLVARVESASPATGSATIHDREQDELLTAALAGETVLI